MGNRNSAVTAKRGQDVNCWQLWERKDNYSTYAVWATFVFSICGKSKQRLVHTIKRIRMCRN